MHNDTIERNFRMVEAAIHQLQTWKVETELTTVSLERRVAILETDNRQLKQQLAAMPRRP